MSDIYIDSCLRTISPGSTTVVKQPANGKDLQASVAFDPDQTTVKELKAQQVQLGIHSVNPVDCGAGRYKAENNYGDDLEGDATVADSMADKRNGL